MDSQKVDMYLLANGKFFPDFQKVTIRERLLKVEEDKWYNLLGTPFKDPTTALILQIFAIGEFYIGNIGIGIAQIAAGVFTCGIGYLWAFIDIFMISDKTKQINYEYLNQILLSLGV